MVRNWGYVQSDEDIGELYITKNQYMGGNMAGIIVNPDNCYKQIGDICNAKTFKFPVRYELLDITHANNVEQELNRIIKNLKQKDADSLHLLVESLAVIRNRQQT